MEGVSSPSRYNHYSDSSSRLTSSLKGPQHSTPVKADGSFETYTSQLSFEEGSLSDSQLSSPAAARITGVSSYTSPTHLSRSAPGSRRHGADSGGGSGSANALSTPLSALNKVRKNLDPCLSSCDSSPSRYKVSAFTPAAKSPGGKGAGHVEALAADSLASSGLSHSNQARLADFENTTIQKQRQELQLMIAELRDRDRELNDMVTAHQKQLAAWEHDRQKILTLEEKFARQDRELQLKDEEMLGLEAKLRVAESEDHNKSTALNCTQEHLAFITEQQSQTSLQLHEIEDKNKSLNGTVMDMSSRVGQFEAREQELITVLQLKDKDLSEAASAIAELTARLQRLGAQSKEGQVTVSDTRRQVTEWKNRHTDARRELEHAKKSLARGECENEAQQLDIQKLRQDVSTQRKELQLANERERRKDQLLDLQKSKQERADAELANLRQLYERQQRDLSLLHLNLETTRDQLQKHNIHCDYNYDRGPHMSSTYQASTQRATGGQAPREYSPSRAAYQGSALVSLGGRGYRPDYLSSDPRQPTETEPSPRQYTGSSHSLSSHSSNGASPTRRTGPGSGSGSSVDNSSAAQQRGREHHTAERGGDYVTPSRSASTASSSTLEEREEVNASGASGRESSHSRETDRTSSISAPAGGATSDGGAQEEAGDIPRMVTPVNQRLTGVKAGQVDSPASKLHKLLTESRDMVQELEQSVSDKDRSRTQDASQSQNNSNRSSSSSSSSSNNHNKEAEEDVLSDVEE